MVLKNYIEIMVAMAVGVIITVLFAEDILTLMNQPEETAIIQEITGSTTILLTTDRGEVIIELFPKKSLVTVQNFLTYVDSGFYDGVIFHRVIADYIVQTGGVTKEMVRKQTRGPIKNESSNGLKNSYGTVAMARTSDPNSATAQFYININNNDDLDYSPDNDGYAVFGRVSQGMDVIHQIAKLPTHQVMEHANVPATLVHIISIKRI